MADIELVIKISGELYRTYKDRPPMLGDVGMDMIAQAIANGKPLPKGHGNIVDIEKLCEMFWDGNFMEIHEEDLPNIPVIIEADKVGEGKE